MGCGAPWVELPVHTRGQAYSLTNSQRVAAIFPTRMITALRFFLFCFLHTVALVSLFCCSTFVALWTKRNKIVVIVSST